MKRLKIAICCFWVVGYLGYCSLSFFTEVASASGGPTAAPLESNAPALSAEAQQEQAKKPDFKRDVLPILEAACYQCHSGEKAQADLRLDSKAAALKGGVSGQAIIPGKGKESLLVQRLHGLNGEPRMPPGKPLTTEQMGTITAWIDHGAEWSDDSVSAKVNDKDSANEQTARTPVATATIIDFVKDIQPILKASCYACHSGEKPKAQLRLDSKTLALKGGVSGPVIVPGNGEGSRLIHRILGLHDEPRMPMGGAPLSPEQIAAIRQWIDQGAPWPDAASAEAKLEKHWAFVAPVRPQLPAVKDKTWVRTPVDRFILAGIEKQKLTPSPTASKITLIRRLSLDLTGLPPSVEEIDKFSSDQSPDAYEKLVERLLASPHYGERWGRHWLDAARYADTNGFEKDRPRSIWLYRDWVINAFNADMPFDKFTVEQLAGDLLPGSTLDQKIATGFLRNSMLNEEGGVDPEQFRVEGLVDRVDTVGKAFLGLTVNCAQCHTHKFDPIPHKEYYQFYAFLNSDEEPEIEVPSEEVKKKRAEIQAQIAKIDDDLIAKDTGVTKRMAQWEESARKIEDKWTVLEETDIFAAFGVKFERLEDNSFIARGDNSTGNNYIVNARTKLQNITGFRLELLTDQSLPRGGPGRARDGSLFLSEFAVEASPASKPEAKEKVVLSRATADFARPDFPITHVIDGDQKTAWSSDAGPGRRNQDRRVVFEAQRPIGFAEGTILTFQLAQKTDGEFTADGDKPNPGRFRLSVTTAAQPSVDPLPAGVRQLLSIPASKRNVPQQREVFSYYRTIDPQFAEANKAIDELLKGWPYGTTTLALAARKVPRETRIFKRGDWRKTGDAVTPGVPSFLNPLPTNAPPNRLGLAQWIVDKKNPLTARVIVNRIWQQYFGQGLVTTPEDFGMRSEQASHPELLDWLALEFQDKGWSMKAIHRLIVTSATYRQSSNVTPHLVEADPYNRWLARAPRLRVDAEIVRDIALTTGGLLNKKIGGPSVFPPLPDGVLDVSFRSRFKWEATNSEDRYRRGLYTFWKRSVTYPGMAVFDAPNADASCTRRMRSNTPLQALTTLNDTVFMEAAQALALRVWKEGGIDDRSRLTLAFRLCVGRKPDAFELQHLLTLLLDQRQFFEGNTAAAVYVSSPDLTKLPEGIDLHKIAPWTMVARVLLNMDETITKE